MLTQERLTQERLREVLKYDQETGVFTWLVRANSCVHIGDKAGCKKSDSYLCIRINYKLYLNHRLAWLYVYGYFPEHGIDHIDRNPENNCINNLREAYQFCNMRNCGNRQNCTSGMKGIYWDKHKRKWHAYIFANNKQNHLGYYSNLNNAVCARLAAEQCVDWSNCQSNRGY